MTKIHILDKTINGQEYSQIEFCKLQKSLNGQAYSLNKKFTRDHGNKSQNYLKPKQLSNQELDQLELPNAISQPEIKMPNSRRLHNDKKSKKSIKISSTLLNNSKLQAKRDNHKSQEYSGKRRNSSLGRDKSNSRSNKSSDESILIGGNNNNQELSQI